MPSEIERVLDRVGGRELYDRLGSRRFVEGLVYATEYHANPTVLGVPFGDRFRTEVRSVYSHLAADLPPTLDVSFGAVAFAGAIRHFGTLPIRYLRNFPPGVCAAVFSSFVVAELWDNVDGWRSFWTLLALAPDEDPDVDDTSPLATLIRAIRRKSSPLSRWTPTGTVAVRDCALAQLGAHFAASGHKPERLTGEACVSVCRMLVGLPDGDFFARSRFDDVRAKVAAAAA